MSYKDEIKMINKNEIQKIYLLYGEEEYLIEKFVEFLKSKILNSGFEELNLSIMDGRELNVEKLIDACETLPFMAEKKLVIINGLEVFTSQKRTISESDEKMLINYIGNIPDTTCLIFYGTNNIDARKKIVKEIKKHGKILKFDKLRDASLRKWIKDRIESYGKSISTQEIAYFMENIDYVGKNGQQNLLDLDKEIKKLISYVGDRKKITVADLENIFISSFQNDIFKLLDAIGKKEVSEALKRLDHMVYQGEAIMRISATLGNQLRNLYKTKLLLEEGYSTKLIASKIGIHPYVAKKSAEQCRDFSLKTLENSLRNYLEMDLAIKSGKMKDDIAIELFIVDICTNE
ncbi:MAG: DNA polymerase III subunit delta [Clostridiales bacterium]|nr:DNA polymerase III subunit delta [Clostridiales bacterium]